VIFTLVLREEAAEPPVGSFGIVPASIKRGDPARIVVGVFQLIRGDCPVSLGFAPCRVQRKQQSGRSPFGIGLPFRSARMIQDGMKPHSPVRCIDTYHAAKRAGAFSSNKLANPGFLVEIEVTAVRP
jgi:hypothetical protein